MVVGIVRDHFAAKGERTAAKFFKTNSQAAYGLRPAESLVVAA
jgi:hypothetical protein